MAGERATDMAGNVKRRLTTVLCADVKSYTRLMEADEAGTLETLRRCRQAMDALVSRHDGRIVNTWGDAIIAEFASVVEAVQCAIEIQTELKARNENLPENHQMWFRIGINLGDVMVEDDNIYGEGVNIAARLQEAADPGGIMISGPVYDQVHHRLSVAFDHVGAQALKNVSVPVDSYRVALDGRRAAAERAPASEGGTTDSASPPHRHGRAGPPFARFADWYAELPMPVAIGLAVVALLFFINLFSGIGSIWFHWPAMPIVIMALFYFMWIRRSRGRHKDRRDRRNRRC